MPLHRRNALMHLAALAAGPALAQPLGSPLGAPPGARPAPDGAPAALPLGQGPGVHSPQSPVAPLQPRDDVVPWSVLTRVTTEVRRQRVVPVYPPEVRALHQQRVRLQGFMMPLEPGEQQRHFLLSSVPLTCAFCTPGGAESLVEVRTRAPVKYRIEAIVVEGRLHVLDNDPYGLFYRLSEAEGSR